MPHDDLSMTTLSSHRRVRVSPAHELRNDVLIKPSNRMVIRIMLMPPLYAVASLISLIAPGKAVLIDAGRDVYEVRHYVLLTHPLVLNTSLGVRDLLLLSPPTLISRRRERNVDHVTRTRTQGTSCHSLLVILGLKYADTAFPYELVAP